MHPLIVASLNRKALCYSLEIARVYKSYLKMSDPDCVEYICPEDKLPAPLPTIAQIDAAVEEEGAEIFYENLGLGCTLFRYSPEFLVFFGPGVDPERIRLGHQRIRGIGPHTRIFGMFEILRMNYLFGYVILDDKLDGEFKKDAEDENGEDADAGKSELAQPSA
ncbi:unnamed protein product [Clonostachys rosea]|uniref:Uncharacterized protein n=1 Tax=Bionectria ochroleuca TaxID=29856 RepID=A0ABY6UAX8_BIOOC|nr:unnamed protein product [Clonostachys rosea]